MKAGRDALSRGIEAYRRQLFDDKLIERQVVMMARINVTILPRVRRASSFAVAIGMPGGVLPWRPSVRRIAVRLVDRQRALRKHRAFVAKCHFGRG